MDVNLVTLVYKPRARVVAETLLNLNVERSLLDLGRSFDQVHIRKGYFEVDGLQIQLDWTDEDINKVLDNYCQLVSGQSRYRKWRLGR